MNYRKTLFISFSFMLVSILLFQSCYAQVRTTGVSEGDWFQYNLSLDFDSILNMTSEDFPFADFLIGQQVTLEIENVSDTNVTGVFTIKYENGTEYFQTGSVDLVSGKGDLRSWLISADLNAGDSLYAYEPDETINETILQTYHWGSRETNHLVYSYNFSLEEDYSYLSLHMFWDKETGVVTELSFEADVFVNGTVITGSAHWIITDSSIIEVVPDDSNNMEDVPEVSNIIEDVPEFIQPAEDVLEFTQYTLILTIVAVTLSISILIYKRQKLIPST